MAFCRSQINCCVPSPDKAEIANTGPFHLYSLQKRFLTASGSVTTSSLFSTNQRGLLYRASSYRRSSSTMARASPTARATASSSGSCDDTSTRCNKMRVRVRWRKNKCPRPAPSEAPSINPGISATTKLRASEVRTTPKFGCSVVNG